MTDQQQQPRGYASVWNKNSGSLRFSGSIEVSPDVLMEWVNLPQNKYGKVELALVLFENDRAVNDRHPQYKGYLQIPRDQQQSAPQQSNYGPDDF